MGLAWLRDLNPKDHGQDAHATFGVKTACTVIEAQSNSVILHYQSMKSTGEVMGIDNDFGTAFRVLLQWPVPPRWYIQSRH